MLEAAALVPRLDASARVPGLPPLNLKKKRDCRQSSLSKSIPWGGEGGTLKESLGRSLPPRPSKVDPV